jgi:type IX secretion system PorP/SprF family membrane protein
MFIMLCCPITIIGQLQTIKYPVRFSQYYNCYSLINPAGSGAYNNFEIITGDKHLLGNFSKISTYYLNANIRIAGRNIRKNSSFSSLGILVYNEREGKYLNRSRFYATYAWHGYITNQLKFSGGFQIGAMNYSVKGTPLSGDGSDTAPDGIVGVWLYNKWFHLGASYNQIFNSKIQPLDEIAILSPYLNIDGSCNFSFSDVLKVSPSFLYRISTNDDLYSGDYSIMIGYKNKIATAIGIHENNRLINSFEIINIFNNKYPLNLSLTYGYPVRPQDINTNFIEFGLKYSR